METLTPFLFWIFAGLAAGSALMTLLAQNVVRSATWLLFSLAGAAGLFFLLGADFVGATQVLIYVGGTLVLLIFGVMLTAQAPFITLKTSAAEWALSLVVAAALFSVMVVTAVAVPAGKEGKTARPYSDPAPVGVVKQYASEKKDPKKDPGRTDPARAQFTDIIGQGFLGVGVGPAANVEGKVIRTSYLLPFEIISVHLLVVLIGAAYLARARRRKGETA